jgi:signal transduction histidine kinase
MAQRPGRVTLGYIGVIAGAFLVAVVAGWTPLANRIDGSAYDWMFQLQPPPPREPGSIILAIDEDTLARTGGTRRLRSEVARGLEHIAGVQPKTVAVDLILSDEAGPFEDAALEHAFRATPNLVLASDLIPNTTRWEEPLPRFRKHAATVGHVHADPDPVCRVLILYKVTGHDRRWAVALEAFRLASGARQIVESPDAFQVGPISIPVRRSDAALQIRYSPPLAGGRSSIPQVSLLQLNQNPSLKERFRNKAVFVGETALSQARDRLMTPYQVTMSGVEIHAQAYETMAHGEFFVPASDLAVIGFCLLIAIAAGFVFFYLTGYLAYSLGVGLLLLAHLVPHFAFARGIVFPYLAPVLTAWLSVVGAAAWMYFVVRRQLRKSESDKARYQQAIHFVTHEMRSPLTAIQGSSELMGRYNLNDEKRKQMAQMINSESKRLARMIQTFLDIERLTDGQSEIRSEVFESQPVLEACIQRAQPLAERKQIELRVDEISSIPLTGDRELMEYAVYNLLTNAIKYSPAETTVAISCIGQGQMLRLSVRDQGIGMDDKELRNIFKKFYRTKKAETSGEVGTGIGLSIVDQIITHHHGHIEVTSTPGKGSCFTIVLPRGVAPEQAPASKLVSN